MVMMIAGYFSFAVKSATGIKKRGEKAKIYVLVLMKIYLKTHGKQHYVILQVGRYLIKAANDEGYSQERFFLIILN